MNILKKILDTSTPSSPTDLNEIVSISSAQLFLKRSPSSPKGELECICNDCVASIRKTTVPFNYQLIIQKAYQEDELDNDDEFSEADESSFENALKDEWEFLIDESLSFLKDVGENSVSISWRELNGDLGDRFQLVVDPKQVKSKTIDLFVNTIYRCEYERKYNVESTDVSDQELIAEFRQRSQQHDEEYLYKQFDKGLKLKQEHTVDENSSEDEFQDASADLPKLKGDITYKDVTALYMFDADGSRFKLKDKSVVVSIINHGKFQYSLFANAQTPVSLPLTSALNPVFDFDTFSFVFNSIEEAKSYLLKFDNFEKLSSFNEAFKIALWEASNGVIWAKVNEGDRDYILNEDNDLVLEDADHLAKESESESEDESEDETEYFDTKKNLRFGKGKQNDDEYDDDDIDGDELARRKYMKSKKAVNSNLVVGYSNNRSYVSRGDSIGVFKDDGEEMVFQAAIENIKPAGAKSSLTPSQMMLNGGDNRMIMGTKEAPNHMYNMDLVKGKIVDDFYAKEEIDVVDFHPSSKLAQLTDDKTFAGLSGKEIFKVDMRLNGKEKLVDSEYKKYATNYRFSKIATTESGWTVVVSEKGEVRLYDKLGLNAKTLLPALGEPMIGADVTRDGTWVLLTCKTHLLLFDMRIKEGKNKGKLGFQASFGADVKPVPIRLTLTAEHIAHMVLKKTPLKFTPARFDVDLSNPEQTIVTSSGPYAVAWSLRKVLRGDKSYRIHHYQNNVVSDNFKFGGDRDVIIALEDDVAMINKKSFKKATRKSLGFGEVVQDYY